jgi:hypothetical protein
MVCDFDIQQTGDKFMNPLGECKVVVSYEYSSLCSSRTEWKIRIIPV